MRWNGSFMGSVHGFWFGPSEETPPMFAGRRRPSGIFLFGQMGHRDPRY